MNETIYHNQSSKSENFVYKGVNTKEISFPLGGIGSGCIGLAGNGRLIDWEIFNRPNKLSHNGFSFFAVKAEHCNEVITAKVLNGDLQPSYTGEGKGKYEGYGYGPRRENMTGFPHFQNTSFKGTFPLAEMTFDDPDDPIHVKLKAFNPFIPLNADDSSIPAGIFTYEVTNRSDKDLDISLVGNLTNPMEKGAVNSFVHDGEVKAVYLTSEHYEPDDIEYGDMSLSTDCSDISYQTYWYRGDWFDNITVFWKDFMKPGKFQERSYDEPRNLDQVEMHHKHRDVGLLSCHQSIQPGETATFRFVITWNFPNYANFWNPGELDDQKGNQKFPKWKNYYTNLFKNSFATSSYVFTNYERLYTETETFADSLFGSTLPDYVLDAISANISILKSPTVLRLNDGTLYGFEGCHTNEGSCEGSCTHVWNYEQVTPFLFPSLARSMREIDYEYAQFENGKMAFRLMLPPERTLTDLSHNSGKKRAAADGQMGGIIKVYREWKVSGDTEWLKRIWPEVKKALEYAWEPTNEDWWDKDCDGVMEGIQHHTLDVEIYGPNAYISGIYHAALLAASKMAEAVGDEAVETYSRLYEQGRLWVDKHLFNGEYFVQQIDLGDDRFPIDEELKEIKYQIGNGCHIDQVLGQYFAHVAGVGEVFDKDKVVKALSSIYRYNFISCLRDYPNACRIYGLNEESGVIICTWPHEDSPSVPVPYADECMNGFEYQVAVHMIYEGMVEEGLKIVEAIRDRYDGEKRNPWNEFECGSNYVRSMASYGLLTSLSGFEYDMVEGMVGFNPKINQNNFECFWSLNQGWGVFTHRDSNLKVTVKSGELKIVRFRSDLLKNRNLSEVRIGAKSVPVSMEGNVVHFEEEVVISKDNDLMITTD